MSRLRNDVAHLFDVFVEVAAPSGDEAPWILWKYPDDYADEGILKAITEFAFPLRLEKSMDPSDAVQSFSFVLTGNAAQYTFGYCRHTPVSNTCLCICTGLPWTNVFYQVLDHVSLLMNTAVFLLQQSESELNIILERIYTHSIPPAGSHLTVETSLGKNKLEVSIPDQSKLPTLTENRNLLEFYGALDENMMIAIYASLLRERHVVFVGKKLSLISSCVQAAGMLIYPMHWQHMYIPMLPVHGSYLSYLTAPIPFIIGVPTSTFEKARQEHDLSDCVVINLDRREFDSPHRDYNELPHEVRAVLKSQLDQCDHMLGDGLCRSFMRATVALIGGYRRGLYRDETKGRIAFDADRFVGAQRASLRPFLTEFRHLQIFQQFIDERVDLLNAGRAPDDEFESELRLFEYRPVKATDLMRSKGREAFSGIQEKVKGMTKDQFFGRRSPGPVKQSSAKAIPPTFSGAHISRPFSSGAADASARSSSMRTRDLPRSPSGDLPPPSSPTRRQGVGWMETAEPDALFSDSILSTTVVRGLPPRPAVSNSHHYSYDIRPSSTTASATVTTQPLPSDSGSGSRIPPIQLYDDDNDAWPTANVSASSLPSQDVLGSWFDTPQQQQQTTSAVATTASQPAAVGVPSSSSQLLIDWEDRPSDSSQQQQQPATSTTQSKVVDNNDDVPLELLLDPLMAKQCTVSRPASSSAAADLFGCMTSANDLTTSTTSTGPHQNGLISRNSNPAFEPSSPASFTGAPAALPGPPKPANWVIFD